MFKITRLTPKYAGLGRPAQSFKFEVKPLVKKSLTPTQDRASFITMLCQQGKSYAEAIRSWDRRTKRA